MEFFVVVVVVVAGFVEVAFAVPTGAPWFEHMRDSCFLGSNALELLVVGI